MVAKSSYIDSSAISKVALTYKVGVKSLPTNKNWKGTFYKSLLVLRTTEQTHKTGLINIYIW